MSKKTLLKFEADWCAPCQQFKPTVDQLVSSHSDQLDIRLIDVDEAANADLVAAHNVRSIPTLVLTEGIDAIATHNGSAPYPALEEWISPYLN